MSDGDKKLEQEIAKIKADYDKKIAAVLDISSDPALEAAVVLETGFSTCVVVENVPVVDEGPLVARITQLLSQIFGRCGKLVATDPIYLPVDSATKKTLGFCIIEYVSEDMAKTAVKALDKFALDKAHTFRVSPYATLVNADNTPDEYVQPEVVLAEKPNLQHWLLDPRGIDQFVTRFDQTVEIDWNTFDYTKTWNDPAQRQPEMYWRKDGWQVGFLAWSPHGSYLASAHANGVVLWGGPAPFDKPIARFEHLGVSRIDFSPKEKFLVTASVKVAAKGEEVKEDDPKTVVIHEVATGKRKLEFSGVKSNVWPLFRWSHDDTFFAMVVKDRLQIYDSSTMQLFGGAALRVPGIKTFSWSPSANVIAYYVPVPEDGNHPAGLTLMELPSKNVLRQKNLFDVKDCRLHWHPSGQYLAVKVDRLVGGKKKSKSARVYFGKAKRAALLEDDPEMEPAQINRQETKVDEMWEKASDKEKEKYEQMAKEDKERYAKELNFSTTFQIFRMEQKGIPVEEIEFDKKDTVIAFAWQPSGNMFAVIHGRAPKPDVSIYGVKKDGVKLLKKFEQRQANHLFWSPVNDFLVLANVKSPQGNLEFVNAGLLESITTAEHQNATEFLWEPRGRYFVSVCSAWRQQVETGFQIYSFNGRLLSKTLKPKFFEFHWRPRPPSLLTTKEEKAVLKKMKETQKEFEKEDELRRRLENRKFFEDRLAIRGGYYKALEASLKEYEELAKKHQALLAKLKRDEEVQVFEETIEQVSSETITVI